MVWYKSWIETRWRFVIGLVILVCSAVACVLTYPMVLHRVALISPADLGGLDRGGVIGDEIREGLAAMRDYRGYVWWRWFRDSLPQIWILFAVLIGTGGLLSQSAGAALFTLSLPVTRARLVTTRAATGLAEVLLLALVPALLIPLLSPAVGQSFDVTDAVIFAISLFVGGAVFYSLAFVLSTVFSDVWRPALIAIAVAVLLGTADLISPDVARYGPFGVITARSYYHSGQLPWVGLLASASASAAMLYAARVNVERRDF